MTGRARSRPGVGPYAYAFWDSRYVMRVRTARPAPLHFPPPARRTSSSPATRTAPRPLGGSAAIVDEQRRRGPDRRVRLRAELPRVHRRHAEDPAQRDPRAEPGARGDRTAARPLQRADARDGAARGAAPAVARQRGPARRRAARRRAHARRCCARPGGRRGSSAAAGAPRSCSQRGATPAATRTAGRAGWSVEAPARGGARRHVPRAVRSHVTVRAPCAGRPDRAISGARGRAIRPALSAAASRRITRLRAARSPGARRRAAALCGSGPRAYGMPGPCVGGPPPGGRGTGTCAVQRVVVKCGSRNVIATVRERRSSRSPAGVSRSTAVARRVWPRRARRSVTFPRASRRPARRTSSRPRTAQRQVERKPIRRPPTTRAGTAAADSDGSNATRSHVPGSGRSRGGAARRRSRLRRWSRPRGKTRKSFARPRVDVPAAVDLVVAAESQDLVAAAAAAELVGAVRAPDRVGRRAAERILDRDQRVVLARAPADPCREVDLHGDLPRGVDDVVAARAAVEHVVALRYAGRAVLRLGVAGEAIVPAEPAQHVGAGAAGHALVPAGAGELVVARPALQDARARDHVIPVARLDRRGEAAGGREHGAVGAVAGAAPARRCGPPRTGRSAPRGRPRT